MPLKNKTFLSNICLYTFLILGITELFIPLSPYGTLIAPPTRFTP